MNDLLSLVGFRTSPAVLAGILQRGTPLVLTQKTTDLIEVATLREGLLVGRLHHTVARCFHLERDIGGFLVSAPLAKPRDMSERVLMDQVISKHALEVRVVTTASEVRISTELSPHRLERWLRA